QDSVLDYQCAQARNGSYILTLFRHMKGGTVQGAEVVLEAVAQQTYMDSSLPVPGFDVRFSALQQVNTAHPLTLPTLSLGESDAANGTVVNFPGNNGNLRVAALVPGPTQSQGPRTLMDPSQPVFVAPKQLWQRGTIAGDTMASA